MSSAPLTSSPIDSDNHGPAVVIAAGVTLGTAITMVMLRMYQRWPWTSIKMEDGTLVVAVMVSVANVVAIGIAVQLGLGQRASRLSDDQLHRTRHALTASFALTFLAEALSATSFICLLYSMNMYRNYRRFLVGLMAAVVAWATGGIIRFGISTVPSLPDPGKGTWIGFGAAHSLLQLLLVGSAFWTIWGLQMPVSKKLGLSLWFSLPLTVVVATICRLVYTPESTFDANFTWNDTNMIIISLAESTLTILSAAYPSVRGFLNQVSTGFLVAETAKDTSRSGSKGNSYALRSIGGGPRNVRGTGKVPALDNFEELGRGAHHSIVVKGDTRSDRSFGSEVIMVRRSVEIDESSVADN